MSDADSITFPDIDALIDAISHTCPDCDTDCECDCHPDPFAYTRRTDALTDTYFPAE